ncbi:MAG: hypothetical protein Kow00121_06340 [Elainellaceae cyanobacterium]
MIILPLIDGLPLTDGTTAKQFFAPNGTAEENDYVAFQWEKPGERGFDRTREQEGDPRAVRVRAISENEAHQLVEAIQERLATKLRQQLEQQRIEVQQQQDKVDQLVEERTKARRDEIDDWASALERREAKAQEQETTLKAELAEQEAQLFAELERKQASLVQWERSIQSLSESLAASKAQVKQFFDAVEPYRLAVPLSVEAHPPQPSEVSLPQNLVKNWGSMLAATGLLLPQTIATSYLLSLVSACYSGSLVLLNGPVGVGKTSIIKNSAKILSGTSKIIPVRPAWLDPSDLLGFFDPLSETFRPSPFLTALKDAKTQGDRLCLVCLDELNLARIENYGADLLSSLEYSRSRQKEQSFSSDDERQGLLLYSPSIETQLWEEARFLHELTDRTHEQTQRLKHVQTLLNDYPSTFHLSPNLVLLGTLNSDETTYDLSPKVIDRSYVITYPPANLTQTSAAADISAATTAILSITALQQAIASAREFNQKSNEWQLILGWNQQYLSVLGIPLGHRASREYQVFHTVATILGLSSQDCLGHFIFTKLLPRISFFKNDITSELFNRWLQELEQAYKSYDPGDVLPQLSKQMQDKRRANVRYWTKA